MKNKQLQMDKICTTITKALLALSILVVLAGCTSPKKSEAENKEAISALLDSFNEAAAKADFDGYFNFFADEAVFIGTDALEHWDKKEFIAYARPHFERGRAWSFKAIERNIYIDNSGKFAWFDELLSTQMKICRGSGVLIMEEDEWKIKQYVLSMTIPNEKTGEVIELKTDIEQEIIDRLSGK